MPAENHSGAADRTWRRVRRTPVGSDGLAFRYRGAVFYSGRVDGCRESVSYQKGWYREHSSRPLWTRVFISRFSEDSVGLVIRRASSSDLAAMGLLWEELADMHAQFAPEWATVANAADLWRAHAAQLLEKENWRLLVAEFDGTLVGFITGMIADLPPVFAVKQIGQISDAIVASRSRRRGVGEALFRALQAWFKERAITIVHLSAAYTNREGQAFWRKMGFQDHMSRLRGEFK